MLKRYSGQHILHQFDNDLESIRTKVLSMGGLVEKQVENSLVALINSDSSLAEQVAMNDYQINAMEVAIDEECNQIIALRQPTANDLRLVMSIIKTISDLERIGDEAEKIGKYAIDLATEDRNQTYFSELKNLGNKVKVILREALDAFARMEVASAYQTAASDKQINQEYEQITVKLIKAMTEDRASVELGLRVMWTARALERIGDHAKNICEYVIFTVEGKDIRHASFQQAMEDFKYE
ncbi:MAG: phosphate transport system regulatory protein PhoU [Candidatus Thioglobus sp.]|nr:MAG: phosphate transport system regulatory protein PhoU [Candidatus Thioglobus sp.]|tara:strand:- start:46 stop:762 length:717 start_codon:yes stop_codon:yes gene_type:complete